MIELLRDALMESLETAAAGGHLLVVGEPGAGKSWMVKSFVMRRKKAGDSVVFLRAEDHIVSSLDDLLKSIGAKNFVAALRTYRGPQKYLVIDSLDSLRAEASQRAFRDLIRIVQRDVPNFNVIASMRTFDTRQSVEFQQLFPAKGEVLPNSLPIPARHFVVPVFSETELMEAVDRDERLRPVILSASSAGRTLLRNPFNLWLIIHLLDAGAPVDWLSTIQSEVQLLDQYWQFRVESRENALTRRRLLTIFTDKMVSTNTLSVALRDIESDQALDVAYKQLLSDEILSRTESDRVYYAHNILFDFAVSRLLLDEKNLIPFVVAAPARSIFYRPSISYFMARLWFRDRALFWQSLEPFFEKSSAISSIAAITPATVIYEVAETKEDLIPIFKLSQLKRPRAIVFLLRAIQAFDGLNSKKRHIWVDFLISVLGYVDVAFLNEYIALLEIAAESPNALPAERTSLANAAVTLLAWMWKIAESEVDLSAAQELANVAAARLIPVIAKQYGVIPQAARKVLEEVLDRFGNPRASANEAFRLASNLDAIIYADPEFAAEIYVRVLGFEETSNEATHIGGAVLPLMSNRKQDFSLAYYILGVKYGLLLVQDLHIAARTAVLSITAEVRRQEGDAITKIGAYERQFNYGGKTSTLVSDRSEIWDQTHKDYTSLELFEQLLRTLAERRKSGDFSLGQMRDILGVVAGANTYAVTWKRVFSFAAYNVELLAAILDLLQVPELLAAPETTVAAGKAIAKAYEEHVFTPQELASIETAILRLPESSFAAIYKDPSLIRNRLLGCIPEAMLSAASTQIVQDLKKTTGVPENTPFFQMGPASFGADVEDGWLKRQGVQTEREDNHKLLVASRPLKAFETQFVNQTPSETECAKIADELWNAYGLLQSTKTVDERVVTEVFTTIAAVAQAVLKNEKLGKGSDIVSKCRVIISDAATYPFPAAGKGADASFDRPMWSPTPKIEAAQGLMHYMVNWGLDSDTQSLAEKLSGDSYPAVRFQIASGLIYLYDRHRDFFWEIANKRLPQENATGVLVALARSVAHPHVASAERGSVLDWETALLARGLPDQHTEDVLEVIVDSLTQLFVYFGEDRAGQILTALEKDPAAHAAELSQMSLSASYYLARGINSDSPEDRNIRLRAKAIVTRVLSAADLAIARFIQSEKPSHREESSESRDVVKEALRIIDNVVFRLYLTLGVNEKLTRDDVKPLKELDRRQLFFELEPIWKTLTTPIVPSQRRLLAPQTTHHLMELFSLTLPYDPPRVLQFTANLLRGYNWGYQFDSMAIGELVRFADVVLADHKDILRDPTNASNLGAILDVFVEAGWSQATQLVMRLDNAVR